MEFRFFKPVFVLFVILVSCQPQPDDSAAGRNKLTISEDQIMYNAKPVKLIGLRCSNALISDQTTKDLIESLDTYKSYGLNTISVYLMGSRFGDIKGYNPDGTLDPIYTDRLERILKSTEKKGMFVILGCL